MFSRSLSLFPVLRAHCAGLPRLLQDGYSIRVLTDVRQRIVFYSVCLFSELNMPISVECPECGARNRFPDHLQGKTGRCKSCQERIPVRASGKKSGRKRKQQSNNTGLIVGGVVGCLVLLIAVGAFFLMSSGGETPPEQLAQDNSTDEVNSDGGETSGGDSAPVATLTAPDASSASSDSSAGTTKPNPATPTVKSPPTPTSGTGGFNQPGDAVSESLAFSRTKDWSAGADPLGSSSDLEPGRPLRVKIDKDSLRGSGLLFPDAPSPFLAVRSGSSSKAKYEVYDVTTAKQIGEAPAGSSSALAALAPDGSYLALSTSVAEKIEVFDIPGKKSLGVLSVSEGARFQITSLAIWNNRLVALSNINKGFKVWELPSGKLIHAVTADDKFNPDYGYCFSPGGRYLAVDGHFLEKRIDLFDLDNGKMVGSISPEGKVKVGELEAMGFSTDGSKLAIAYGVDIFTAPARKYTRFVVWDVAAGKIASDFEIEPRLKEQFSPVYKCHSLQALPGGNRWLVHSQGIVDAGVEKLIYSFPKQAGVDLVPSRKVMGANWLLAVTTEGGDPRLEQTEFTEESLLAGAASAAAGGFASDANMPPLSPTDRSRAQDAIAVNQWNAIADPLVSGPVSASIKVTSRGIVRDIALARGENAVIAVRTGVNEDLSDPAITNYEQSKAIYASRGLELERPQPIAKESELIAFAGTGMQLAKLTVPFSGELHGISPDGKLAVLEEHRTNGRLDVYALQDDGKHLVGWRPFRDEGDKNHREIKRVEFVDANHVATLSANYQFVVWKLPSLEAVWKLDEVLNFTVSPGGNQVAVVRGGILGAKGLAMFESQSGKGVGSVDFTGQSKAIAYHPNGELLAISLDSEANQLLRIMDVTTGQTAEEFPIPVVTRSIAWTGQDNLLLNGTQLVNRPLQSVVWSYDTTDLLLPQFQTSEQFVVAQTPANRALIRSVSVPAASVAAKLDASRLADQAILKPGDAVSLDLKIAGDADLIPLQGSTRRKVEVQLEAAKSNVERGAPVTLFVEITLKNEGNVTISRLGDRSVTESVVRKTIRCEVTYKEKGKVIWNTNRRVGNLDRILVRLKQGQSAQSAIDEQMIENTEAMLANLKLPSYIFGENASKGLGTSSLFQ